MVRVKYIFWCLWNQLKLRRMGAQFGSHLRVADKLYMEVAKNAKISIGRNFTFRSEGGYNPITSNIRGYLRMDDGAVLIVGDNCGMSSTSIWIKERITIGNNVLFGGGILIMDNDCHSLDYMQRGMRGGCDNEGGFVDAMNAKRAPITIEDDVLIGARSIILKGVTVGARSVIGAGSVVTHSIPPDCIAAGNPCKVIKMINQ